MDRLVREQVDGGVWTLTIDRPASFNALSLAVIEALRAALARAAEDPTARVVVLEGAGGRAFCAGHDLKEMRAARDEASMRRLFDTCAQMMLDIARHPLPVVAAVRGIAAAAGCQLALEADLAVVGRSARFATPGVKFGLFCSTPMVPLMRAAPKKAAMRLLMTGEPIDAEEAQRLGMIDRVVDDAAVDAELARLIDALLRQSRAVLALGKRAHFEMRDLGVSDAYRKATDIIVENALAPEFEVGVEAFVEKKAPVWPAPATVARQD